jgi:hypothetical protein
VDINNNKIEFQEVIAGLLAGDFSHLAPLFAEDAPEAGQRCAIIGWYEHGLFEKEPKALAEALTCACFNGCTSVAETLLRQGVDPEAGNGTGLNAFHWAVNRGQLEVVRLLLRRQTPLETRSMYDGTMLGTAVWAAVHESRPDHFQIIEALLDAGAKVNEAEYPSGNLQIDELLRHHGATKE